jgi:hypothetical protein
MCFHHEFYDNRSSSCHFHSKNSVLFLEWLNRGNFMISLSGCVAELGVGGVRRNALARTFQRTKKCWILLSGSKVMII